MNVFIHTKLILTRKDHKMLLAVAKDEERSYSWQVSLPFPKVMGVLFSVTKGDSANQNRGWLEEDSFIQESPELDIEHVNSIFKKQQHQKKKCQRKILTCFRRLQKQQLKARNHRK